MAISFAVWLAVTLGANGQQPVAAPTPLPLPTPMPTIVPGMPAPTQWAPFPQLPPVNANPAPIQSIPALNPPATIAPIPTRPVFEPKTVTYQKPAGDTSPTLPLGATPAVVRLPVAAEVTPKEPDAYKPSATDKPKEKPTSDLSGLPNRDDVFRLISDKELNARILKELNKPDEKFPPQAPLKSGNETYVSRVNTYAPIQVLLEPNYVVHRRLYFEEVNSERSGWDAGPVQSVISAGYFYKDVLFWPHNLASGFWKNRYDVSSGKCMPGSPTPYYLYPPGFTAGGTLTEAVVLTGTAFIFP